MGKIKNLLRKIRNSDVFIFYVSLVRNFPLTIAIHRFVSNVYLDTLLGFVLFPFSLLFHFFLRIRYMFTEPKYELAIVMIIKNEVKDILEVINYYKIIGFDKFYIYDNDSTDDVYIAIKEYIDSGFVVYQKIHGKRRQKDAYTVFLNRYGYLFKYASFFDADEFLKTQNNDAKLDVDNVFKRHGNISVGAIGINWIVFGTNGHIERPDGGVIKNYIKATKYDFYMNINLKFICKPKCTLSVRVPHYPYLLRRYRYVTSSGNIIKNIGTSKPSPDGGGLLLYHYYTKSKNEYYDRINKGCVFSGAKQKRIEPIDVIDNNCVYEYALYDFIGYKR